MQFNSYLFILFFLPVTLVLYFLLHHFKLAKCAKIELLLMSLWFYGYFDKSYLLIICFSIVINYLFSKLLLMQKIDNLIRRLLLAGALFSNLGLLFYFKYFDFFLENLNLMGADFNLRNIVLPLGISFFTFQQVSYVIDSYKKETQAYPFLDYAVFVAFFPQLVAGPIVLHGEMIPQFEDPKNHKPNSRNLSFGLYVFAIGLFKKVLIADTFGKAVNWGYSSVDFMTCLDAAIVMLSYTFQIYFDFSGYCDMATGIAAMFNIKLPVNFNSPYKARSIVEFWERWHMTLTRFLRQYIYFPLGGSRKGRVRTYQNIMIVFLVSGLWHGADWTFILWGAIHGAGNVLSRACKGFTGKVNGVVRLLVTFLFVNLAWILFRAESVAQAVSVYKKLLDFSVISINETMASGFNLPEISYILDKLHLTGIFSRVYGFHMWVFLAGAFILVMLCKNVSQIEWKPTIGRAFTSVILLVWSIVSLSGITTFLYFNF